MSNTVPPQNGGGGRGGPTADPLPPKRQPRRRGRGGELGCPRGRMRPEPGGVMNPTHPTLPRMQRELSHVCVMPESMLAVALIVSR